MPAAPFCEAVEKQCAGGAVVVRAQNLQGLMSVSQRVCLFESLRLLHVSALCRLGVPRQGLRACEPAGLRLLGDPALRTSRKLRPGPRAGLPKLAGTGVRWVSGLRLGCGAARSPEPEAAAFAAHRADQSSFCEFCASNPSGERKKCCLICLHRLGALQGSPRWHVEAHGRLGF